MAIDENILQTLLRIEKALKVPVGRTVAGGADQGNKQASSAKKDAVFVASAKTVNSFTEAMKGAASSTERFKRTIERTDIALSALSKRINNVSPVSRSKIKTKGVNLQVGDLEETLQNLNKTIGDLANPTKISNRLNGPTGLFRQLTTLTARVRMLNGALAKQAQPSTPQVQDLPTPPDKAPSLPKGALAGLISKLFGEPIAPKQTTDALKLLTGRVALTSIAFGTLISAVKNTASTLATIVTDDMFQTLAARGYGTTDNLARLYKDAFSAGMSLKEYTQMMDENMNNVSRSKNFEDFQKNLSSTKNALGAFGIFGQEAATMTGSIMSASSAWGVPQEKLSDTVNGQISVFEKLRKTTNITAEGFTELIKALRDDFDIQTEMIGLHPQERAIRMQEIQQSLTYGKALNLTTQQQNQVTEALKAGRRATIRQRFQQAGMIRQTGGLIGMDSNATEELARLALIRNRTAEQDKRFLELNAQQTAALEKMMQSGDPGRENIAQIMTERRDSAGLSQLDRAANSIALAKDAGAIQNIDMGKKLGEASQALGRFITMLESAGKNPVGNLAMQAVGGIVGLIGATIGGAVFANVVGGKIARAVQTALMGRGIAAAGGGPGGPGGPGMPVPVPSGGKGTPKPKQPRSFMGRMGYAAGSLVGSVKGALGFGEAAATAGAGAATTVAAGTAASGAAKTGGGILLKSLKVAGAIGAVLGPLMSVASVLTGPSAEERAQTEEYKGDVGKVKGQDWGEVTGQIIGGALPALIGPIGLAISPFTSMLGGWMGKAIGGWFGSESETEKNTRELKKNTERLRATAASNTITADQLGTLTGNVLQTAKAYSDPSLKAKDNSVSAQTGVTPLAKPKPENTSSATSMVPPLNSSGSFIAAPTAYVQKTVNPGDINKPTNVVPPAPPLSSPLPKQETISSTASPTLDQAAALQQLIILMQQANEINTRTSELQERMLRSIQNQSSPTPDILFGRAVKH